MVNINEILNTDIELILNIDGMGYELIVDYTDDGVCMLRCPDIEEERGE